MNAIIIDDEVDAIESLKSMIKLYNLKVKVIGTANSALSAVKLIDKLKPQLIFLDIEMTGGNGFEVIENLKYNHFQTIFVTAYSEYAIKALRLNASDYLLKPIDPDDLKNAIIRVKKRLKNEINPIDKTIDTIKIQVGGGILFKDTKTIIRLEADSNYTNIFIENEKPLLVSKTLKSYEEILSNTSFIRVHQSHLINLNFVKEFHRKNKSHLILKNSKIIPVSKRKVAAINTLFNHIK